MSDTAQWGDAGWGEAGFAENDQPLGHSMRARFAVNTRGYARHLSPTHHLSAVMRFATTALSIGYGPAEIHPLAASPVFDVIVSAPNLTFSHTLSASFTFDVLTDPAHLSFTHRLRAAMTLDTDASAKTLSQQHLLRARLVVDTPASASQINLGHSLSAAMLLETLAYASESAVIPAPDLLPVAGVVNLIVNPVAALTLEDWGVENGALFNDFETDHIWFGEHSVAVEFHNPPDHERIIVGTPSGLGILPYPGSVLWGEAMLAVGDATDVTANVWTRVQFSDTTIADGDPIEVALTATGDTPDDWQLVQAPYVIVDADLAIKRAWVVIEPTGAGAFPLVLYVGGAQVEMDSSMVGPAPIIVPEAA